MRRIDEFQGNPASEFPMQAGFAQRTLNYPASWKFAPRNLGFQGGSWDVRPSVEVPLIWFDDGHTSRV